MKTKDIKPGMKVRISLDCKYTKLNCGLTSSMNGLKGQDVTISEVYKTSNTVKIHGYNWHAGDLIDLRVKRKKIKPILFDEKLVWI